MVSRMAYVYRQQGRNDEAEAFLMETMKKRPDLVAIYPLLAAVFEDQKKYEDSRQVLERGEKLFPNDENILYYLGFVLDRLGEKENARAKMEKLLTVNPNNANALNFVGYALLEQGKQLDTARTYLKRAVSLKPGDAFILDSYGWLLYRTGDRAGALKQLEKAFSARPDEGVIAEHLADVYVSMSLPRKALLVYEQALKSGGDREFVARVQAKMVNVREVLAGAVEQPVSPKERAEQARFPASR
jgi:tetratricopeptide (TPR) repeat protein